MTWVRALGITLLLLLVVAYGVFPYLLDVMEQRGVSLPGVTILGITLMTYVRIYWYIFLVLGVGLTLIPTKSIEDADARVKPVEPYLLFIVIALMLLVIGILALPLITEMVGAPPPLKKK